ncbi:hypothetical protein HPB48_016676 [Haemaphysalis longicornis]|uniref:Guided entry of tail-anchored proteins factor 1 n=1 Tax=Haemaphysalis longicornis TaxID=44386 RepID=A0A9J6H181_HAELO|nr:hypothetical protein HPB48_016676 [Haemaphysalis longicornis]
MESNLRRQVCDLRAELGGMSIVDEFAKYAKIQRKINKMSEEMAHQGGIGITPWLLVSSSVGRQIAKHL